MFQTFKKRAKQAIGATILLAAFDSAVFAGKYGGKALDLTGSYQAANNYRYVGRAVNGLGQFIVWAFKDGEEELNGLGNKYGQPRP